jgi:biotin synthase
MVSFEKLLKTPEFMENSDFVSLVSFFESLIISERVTLENIFEGELSALFTKAEEKRIKHYGREVFVRGLIEFTNVCKNNCFYCGIRKDNDRVKRYCFYEDEILSLCRYGYDLGFRTFVLQGGENPSLTDEKMCRIVSAIRKEFTDCAVTLSLGERTKESYQRLFDAGANRYLLRHETADDSHYGKLHPKEMSLQNRIECLFNLKEIGYQVGAGFMVCSPYQTAETLALDLSFLKKLSPHMVGIGPFIKHRDTPFGDIKESYSAKQKVLLTLVLLSTIRILLPSVLLPATTALGTIHPKGREMGLRAGANVVMPNLTPPQTREKYTLYDGKICMGDETAECINCLKRRTESVGYILVNKRGDYKDV